MATYTLPYGVRTPSDGFRNASFSAAMASRRSSVQEVTDLYCDWERLRGVDEDGTVLVRPDKHIGWRSQNLPEDPAAALRDALARCAAVLKWLARLSSSTALQ